MFTKEDLEKMEPKYYGFLDNNKNAFKSSIIKDVQEGRLRGGRSSEVKLKHIIKALLKLDDFTEDKKDYLKKCIIFLKKVCYLNL
jgi:hypothetical protein